MFGSGDDLTVFGGGTVLMPEVNAARLRPERPFFLHRTGLTGIDTEAGSVRIGAATTLEQFVEHAPTPLSDAAAAIADPEVRRLATIGGNLSIPYAGDLQAVLLALDASVAHTGSGGEVLESIATYLERVRSGERRLALEVTFERATESSYVRLDRAHTNSYTTMAVTAVRSADSIRVAAKGAAAQCIRLQAVEAALADGDTPEAAAVRALDDANPVDDVLASAWYRRRVLPHLVQRAVSEVHDSAGEA